MEQLARLMAVVGKEFRVLARDLPALAVLFLMPLGFVTVMSLALQDVLSAPDSGARLRFSIAVIDRDGGEVGRQIVRELERIRFLEVLPFGKDDAARSRMQEAVHAGSIAFGLQIPAELTRRIDTVLLLDDPSALLDVPPARKIAVELLVDPALRADHRLLVTTALGSVLQGVEIRRAAGMLALNGVPGSDARQRRAPERSDGLMALSEAPTLNAGAPAVTPTSAQQNVPAYSLLAIFMLVVPLSQTFIKERQQGSLTRLRAMPVPAWVIIGGKFVPYLAINLLQMALCLGVGRYLLPLLGGSPLHFGDALPGILLLSLSASVAAIGFGLAVAMFASTVEQATAFGAATILLFAALGGIMVPRMMMPPALQQLAQLSPLGWAQDGFLSLLARGAGIADVAGNAGLLAAFGAGCLALAVWRFGRLDGARPAGIRQDEGSAE